MDQDKPAADAADAMTADRQAAAAPPGPAPTKAAPTKAASADPMPTEGPANAVRGRAPVAPTETAALRSGSTPEELAAAARAVADRPRKISRRDPDPVARAPAAARGKRR